MSSNKEYSQFLREELPKRLAKLTKDTEAKFGLMTPQHMVEHLVLMTKLSVRRYGDAENPPTEGQLKFKNFIAKGAKFEYKPSDKTKDDLPKLKYGSLQEAIESYPSGIEGFYHHYKADPDYLSYNPFQGELGFEDLESLHYSHFEHHLNQFGL